MRDARIRTAGVIGGLGPDTTSEFYLKLVRLCRQENDVRYPPITIHSISFPFRLEREIIRENRNEREMFPILVNGLRRLERAGVDFSVIPCNTLHLFMEELRAAVATPLLSIIETTAEACEQAGYAKVGILGTTKTITARLFDRELEQRRIAVVVPDSHGQDKVAESICRTLDGVSSDMDRANLVDAVHRLQAEGAQAVILGCTDLQLVLKQDDSPLPLLDTVDVLAEATVREMVREGNH